MIKNIFIPEKVGSFYIFTERIVGIEITQTEVLAVLVIAHGSRKRIEMLIKEPIKISPDSEESIQEQSEAQNPLAKALAAVFEKIGTYTQLIACIPSEVVIFKDISVPLMNMHKLKMIVPFEIESLLPFSLDQAAIDSILVQEDKQANKADLFVAAMQQEPLRRYLAPFVEIKKTPDRVTTDVFELYSLYHAIPEYHDNQQTTLLLMIDETTTQILLLVHNKIAAVRVIQKGISLLRGESSIIHVEDQNTAHILDALMSEVNMTRESFLARISGTAVEKIVLCGKTTEIKGFQEYVTHYFNLPCELLTLNRILHNNTITSKNALSNEFVIPLAAALSLPATQDINLNRLQAEEKTDIILDKQLLAAGILIALLLSMLLINSFFTKRSLSKEIAASESEAVTLLTKKLNLTVPKGRRSIEHVNALARQEIERKENIWFALSSGNRYSFLAYLQDISTRINRESLGLDLHQLTINKDTSVMTLEGQVKNFEALRTLEQDLNQSKLFASVSKPQDLKFNISISLNKPYGEKES